MTPEQEKRIADARAAVKAADEASLDARTAVEAAEADLTAALVDACPFKVGDIVRVVRGSHRGEWKVVRAGWRWGLEDKASLWGVGRLKSGEWGRREVELTSWGYDQDNIELVERP